MTPLAAKSLQHVKHYGRRVYRSLYFPPFILFLAMLLVTYWSYRASLVYLARDQQRVISEQQEEVAVSIENRLVVYEQILRGGAGLVRSSNDVTEAEWHSYIETYDVTNRLPGVQTIGYIKALASAALPNLVQYMQQQGFSDFSVKPAPTVTNFTSILYTSPIRTSTVRGADLSVDPTRRQSMEYARDTGTTTLTPPLRSIYDTTAQPVFQMFVPEYRPNKPLDTSAERTSALGGYVFASFRANDFFNRLLPVTTNATDMAFQVSSRHDDNEELFYETDNWRQLKDSGNAVMASQIITLYGREWKIDYAFNPGALTTAQRRNAPLIIIIAGSLFSLLLAEVIYLLLKTRARELMDQRDRAVDLAKDELLSLASHQLRTPATTVKQYLGMVLQGFTGELTETQENLLQKAYTGNERQLRIINEMLHVAKIDSGRITLAKQSTNMNELLEEIVVDMLPGAETAGHTLTVKTPKRPVVLDIDDHMIRMAIENLVSNAIKYTLSDGKIQITMRRHHGYIHIVIKDNGIGIDKKDMRKLYKVFTRLNNRLTQTVSGTGVGLYLAKHLVELHGGSISAESLPGKGSTFTIKLPA